MFASPIVHPAAKGGAHDIMQFDEPAFNVYMQDAAGYGIKANIDKDVMVGVIDVAGEEVETPEQTAETIGQAVQFVPASGLYLLQMGLDDAAAPGIERHSADGAPAASFA